MRPTLALPSLPPKSVGLAELVAQGNDRITELDDHRPAQKAPQKLLDEQGACHRTHSTT
jgi:hypothetical protein